MKGKKSLCGELLLLKLCYCFSPKIVRFQNGSIKVAIYYIKVSGIPSGNKLIKTTCEDIIFDNISLFSLQLH